MTLRALGAVLVVLLVGCGSSSDTTTDANTTAKNDASSAETNSLTVVSDAINTALKAEGSALVSAYTVDQNKAATRTVNKDVGCPGNKEGSSVTVTGTVITDDDADGGGSFDLSAVITNCLSINGTPTAVGSYTESNGVKTATGTLNGTITVGGCDTTFSGTTLLVTVDATNTVTSAQVSGSASATCDGIPVSCSYATPTDVTNQVAINAGCST